MNGKGVVRGLGCRHSSISWIPIWWTSRRGCQARNATILPKASRSGPAQRRAGFLPSNTRKKSCRCRKNSATSPSWSTRRVRNGEKNQRCTSCGICAKVCPPQCIWIVRTSDPVTGRPVPSPAEFYIDVDICMNCGLCAEYCPFDAIKMDHDYEIASYNRHRDNIYDINKLSKPVSYYAKIRPTNYAREEAARQAEKEAKAAKKAGAAAAN